MSHHSWVRPRRPHRARAPVSVQFRSPGPKYRLPGGIGSEQRDPSSRRAPAYSFGRKLGRPEEPRSPGPQYLVPTGFTSRGRERAPAFSMGRLPRERSVSSTPGPAQYHPELANRATLPCSPACVFIPRGRPDKAQETPGPASYQLPPVMGPRLVTKRSAPEYSMAGRRRSLFDPRERVGDGGPGEQTPGPSNYRTVDTDVYMARAPRCTMAGRSRPVPIAKTPGPCDYSPRQATKQGQSFGVRHSDSVIPVMDPQP